MIPKHMEVVHTPTPVAAPTLAKPEEAEDIDMSSLVNKVDKGFHEMSREEWRQWRNLWEWWRSKQLEHLDLTPVLLGRFPKIIAKIASVRGTREFDE